MRKYPRVSLEDYKYKKSRWIGQFSSYSHWPASSILFRIQLQPRNKWIYFSMLPTGLCSASSCSQLLHPLSAALLISLSYLRFACQCSSSTWQCHFKMQSCYASTQPSMHCYPQSHLEFLYRYTFLLYIYFVSKNKWLNCLVHI